MTCKIERLAAEGMVVFRVSGHIQAEHVSTLKELIAREDGQIELDLCEITLVDRDAVSYLALCELRGIEFSNCPHFLRDWVTREQLR
jgi:hypothetical protein